MRCIDCEFYITAEQTGDLPGCTTDGDVTNPTEDINCVGGGDKELCSTTPPPETKIDETPNTKTEIQRPG